MEAEKFASLASEEIDELVENKDSKNTKKATKMQFQLLSKLTFIVIVVVNLNLARIMFNKS